MLMALFMSGESFTKSRLKIEISMKPASHPIYAFLKMYVLDADRKRKFVREDEFWFRDVGDQSNVVWHFPFNVDRKKLKKEFLPNDVLSLGFEFTFSFGVDVHNIESISDSTQQVSICGEECVVSKGCSFSNHLFSDNRYCDASVNVEGENIPVYRVVLCKKSPIFRAMFETDMQEKQSNCLEIVDFEKETVKRLINYLYDLPGSANFTNLDWKSLVKLYLIADKYLVSDLKKDCVSFFRHWLSLSNVFEVLDLSDRTYDTELKEIVNDFLSAQDKMFFESKKCNDFKTSNPKLYNETIECLFKKLKEEI